MKPIKICDKNAKKIEAALKEVNGEAFRHSLTDYKEIQDILIQIERKISHIQGVKKYWEGVVAEATGGGKVANAYGTWRRISTEIKIERIKGSWKITAIRRCELYANQGGEVEIFLTKEVEEHAREWFSRLYKRIPGPLETTEETIEKVGE